jgi:hypothetical protein
MIKTIVCDVEYAERLRELGFKVDNNIFWYCNDKRSITTTIGSHRYVPTYTTGELGNMLPNSLPGKKDIFFDRFHEDHRAGYRKYDEHNDNYKYVITQVDTNEANSRAKLLIYLIENEYINIGSK